jgi:hypothetical protein
MQISSFNLAERGIEAKRHIAKFVVIATISTATKRADGCRNRPETQGEKR